MPTDNMDKFLTGFDKGLEDAAKQKQDRITKMNEWQDAIKAFIIEAKPIIVKYQESFKDRGIAMTYSADESTLSLSVNLVPPKKQFRDNDRVGFALLKGLNNSERYEFVWIDCAFGKLTRAYGGYSGSGSWEPSSHCNLTVLEELIQKTAERYKYHFIEGKV